MINRQTLIDRLSAIGAALKGPGRLCLIGSGATLLAGQPDRQTPDIDVWRDNSVFDLGDFRNACLSAGLLFDPSGDVPEGSEYIQIVRSGVVSLPKEFPVGHTESFGNLTVFTPPLALIAALKLARGNETDIEDASWIVQSGHADLDAIRSWSQKIPNQTLSETSLENIVVLELIMKDDNAGPGL